MKRWPILVSFVLFVGLCVSGTFWAMQLFKPTTRPVAALKQQSNVDVDPEAVKALFGGRTVAVAAASNFQLKGVVVANNASESVAILAADGKPAEAVRVNAEVVPGVTVKEVHSRFVLLSEGGVSKRVELPVSSPHSKADILSNMAPQAQFTAPQLPPQGVQSLNTTPTEGEPLAPTVPTNLISGRIGHQAGRERNNN